MDKNAAFTRGNLAIVWDGAGKPSLDPALVLETYQQGYLPALERDLHRALAVWAGSVRKTGPVSFERYWDGMTEAKKDIGKLALPGIEALDRELTEIHERYVTREIYGVESHCNAAIKSFENTALSEDDPGYFTARRNCISRDTSAALNDFCVLINSFQGRAALYDAHMGDPEQGHKNFVKTWIADRRYEDLGRLSDDIFWSMVSPEFQNRRRLAEAKFHTEPAQGDLEVELRQHNLRCVTPRFRAA